MIENKVYSKEAKRTPIYKAEKGRRKVLKEVRTKYIPYQNIRVELVKEPASKLVKVSSPADIFDEMKEEVNRLDREHLWVLCLNQQNILIGINTVSIGTANSAPVSPREIFKPAILVNSINIIIFPDKNLQSHPGLILFPSIFLPLFRQKYPFFRQALFPDQCLFLKFVEPFYFMLHFKRQTLISNILAEGKL